MIPNPIELANLRAKSEKIRNEAQKIIDEFHRSAWIVAGEPRHDELNDNRNLLLFARLISAEVWTARNIIKKLQGTSALNAFGADPNNRLSSV